MYDFDTEIITEGDYYCILDESDHAAQRDMYYVYFYDVSTHTLYYIHNNG